VARQDVSDRSAALRAGRVPFVHARVVLAEPPTSAKPGDEAIVLEDGGIDGFVGGACVEGAVRRHALDALRDGEAVVLRVTPRPEPAQRGKQVVHNPCLSGGSLEIFLEPSLPPPLVLVVGDSPTAAALLALGASLGYDVRPWAGELEPDAVAVVVASHGKGEEAPLLAALDGAVPYVGVVASRQRGAAVVAALGVADDVAARVRTPAGLDIGARTPGEVALSILAEIVAGLARAHPRRAPAPTAGAEPPPEDEGHTEIDPVCGMSVAPVATTLHGVHPDPVEGGRTVWFCGSGCKAAFFADPASYPVRS
jgi:xanthine dehydrogenase accessory factor